MSLKKSTVDNAIFKIIARIVVWCKLCLFLLCYVSPTNLTLWEGFSKRVFTSFSELPSIENKISFTKIFVNKWSLSGFPRHTLSDTILLFQWKKYVQACPIESKYVNDTRVYNTKSCSCNKKLCSSCFPMKISNFVEFGLIQFRFSLIQYIIWVGKTWKMATPTIISRELWRIFKSGKRKIVIENMITFNLM